MALELIGALLLVGTNGFFVATEFGIARLRPTQVEDFLKQGRTGAKSVKHAVDNIDAYLAACQLGITISSLGLGALGKPAFEDILDPILGEEAAVLGGISLVFLIAFLVITTLHVVLGELSPKSLAIARTGRTALMVAPPMRVFYLVTKPVVDLFNGMGNLVLKPFGVPPAREAGHAPHSEAELRTILRQSQAAGEIEREDWELSENVFSFGDMRVREVMMPRPDIDYVTADDDVRSAAARGMETGHTRLPLCEPDGGLDAVVGVLHIKDLLTVALRGEEAKLTDLAREISRFSESTLIDEVLRELQRRRQHMALVLDEHGTTIGLVTLEDILEELVGEIEDEFDPESVKQIRHDGDVAVVDGSAPIRLLAQELQIEIPDPHEATIGGHILELLGRMPEVGEVIELDGYRAEVESVEDTRITALRFKRKQEAE